MYRSVRMISDDEDNNYKLLPVGFPVHLLHKHMFGMYEKSWWLYSTCCLQNLHWIGTEVGLATPHSSPGSWPRCPHKNSRSVAGVLELPVLTSDPGQVVQRRPRDQDWYLFITRVGSGGEGAIRSLLLPWRNRLRFSSLSPWWFCPQILGQEQQSSTQQDITTIEEMHISIFLWSWSFLWTILYTTLLRSYWIEFHLPNYSGNQFRLQCYVFLIDSCHGI